VDQAVQQVVRAVRTFTLQHRLQRFQPLSGFLGIQISLELIHVHASTFLGLFFRDNSGTYGA
jgi:hypothetical protein